MISFSSLSKRRGATLAGVFSLALSCVLLLCGAGSTPVENLLPQGALQGDLNAGGHNLTNAATMSATNLIVSGSLAAPSSFTLPFSKLTSTPTTLAGYGITDGGGSGFTPPYTPSSDTVVFFKNFANGVGIIGDDANGNPYLQGRSGPSPGDLLGFDPSTGTLTLNGNDANTANGLLQEGGTITDTAGNQITIGDETGSGSAIVTTGNLTAQSVSVSNSIFLNGGEMQLGHGGTINGYANIVLGDPNSPGYLFFGAGFDSTGGLFELDSANDGVASVWLDQSDTFWMGRGNANCDEYGNITAVSLTLPGGTNTKSGAFTLSSGSATVSNTSVTANSIVMVTVKTIGGTRTGNPDIVPTAGTGFTATGGSLDTSTYNYVIIN